MSFNFTSSDQKGRGTQTIAVPEPSGDEKALRKLNLQLAQRQLASLEAADAQATADANDPLNAKKRQLESSAIDNLLARINGTAPALSPEAQARLDTIYGSALGQGESDVLRFGRDMASSRGMALTDSPIGNEVTQRQRELVQNLAGQKAAAGLNLGNADAIFQQATADFARQLQDRAFQNRLAIAGMTPAPYGLQSSLFGERLAQGTRSMSNRGNASGYGYGLSGQDVSGYGSGLYGAKGGGLLG